MIIIMIWAIFPEENILEKLIKQPPLIIRHKTFMIKASDKNQILITGGDFFIIYSMIPTIFPSRETHISSSFQLKNITIFQLNFVAFFISHVRTEISSKPALKCDKWGNI